MSNPLYLEVKCTDGESWEGPGCLVVELSARLVERICTLACAVRALKVYRVSEFNYDPVWHAGSLPTGVNGDLSWEYAEEDLGGSCRMDAVLLHVKEHGFYWSGYSKEDDLRYESEDHFIHELPGAEEFRP